MKPFIATLDRLHFPSGDECILTTAERAVVKRVCDKLRELAKQAVIVETAPPRVPRVRRPKPSL